LSFHHAAFWVASQFSRALRVNFSKHFALARGRGASLPERFMFGRFSRAMFPRFGAFLTTSLIVGAALLSGGCGEYHMMAQDPPPRQTEGDPQLFATGAGREGTVIAVVQSRPRSGLDDATMAKHVREVRGAARRAKADAVINLRVLTVKKEGFVSDPAPPFPAIKQDAYARYIMRGDAIVYDELEGADAEIVVITDARGTTSSVAQPQPLGDDAVN
jgi:hypothetical protein